MKGQTETGLIKQLKQLSLDENTTIVPNDALDLTKAKQIGSKMRLGAVRHGLEIQIDYEPRQWFGESDDAYHMRHDIWYSELMSNISQLRHSICMFRQALLSHDIKILSQETCIIVNFTGWFLPLKPEYLEGKPKDALFLFKTDTFEYHWDQ